MELMGHIPGIAMRNHEQRFGQVCGPRFARGSIVPALAIQGLPVPASDLNPSTSIPLEKFSPWPKENRGAERGVVVTLVISFGHCDRHRGVRELAQHGDLDHGHDLSAVTAKDGPPWLVPITIAS
jgi:hypothetical protein